MDAEALAAALGAAPVSDADSCADSDDATGADDGERDWDDAEAEGGAEWAAALRDRLLCALYSRLFTWLINAVNDAIKVSGCKSC